MYFQLIAEVVILIVVAYAIYRFLFSEKIKQNKETKRLLKEQKLQELKEKEKELEKEVDITENLINTKKDVTKLDHELKKLDKKISEGLEDEK